MRSNLIDFITIFNDLSNIKSMDNDLGTILHNIIVIYTKIEYNKLYYFERGDYSDID